MAGPIGFGRISIGCLSIGYGTFRKDDSLMSQLLSIERSRELESNTFVTFDI
ncbi:MAG: hypothetical protein ABL994_18160 [Verrucomicrobiales bacterium]